MITVNTFGDLVISHTTALVIGSMLGFALRGLMHRTINRILKKTP